MRPRFRIAPALFALLFSLHAHATVYAVGAGAGCNELSLYDAINAAIADPIGPHLIKLGTGSYILTQYNIENPAADITIEGGYQHCSDTDPTAGQRATLTNNTPPATTRLLYLSNALNQPRRSITLRHLRLTGGSIPSDSLGGGAIYAQGNLELDLDDAQVDHNIAQNGGGLSLLNLSTDSATQTVLNIAGRTQVTDNQATGTINSTGNGGGIYAIGEVRIVFSDGLVQNNTARRAGGGIAIRTNSASLDFAPSPGATIDISDNTAGRSTFASTEGFGGGIYSEEANISTTFSGVRDAYQVYLLYNNANYGGAIYVEGNPDPAAAFTFVMLRNTLIGYNEAYGKGGGLYSDNAVDWNIDHQAIGKCTFFTTDVCSLIIGNQSDNTGTPGTPGGGAIYLTSQMGSQRGIARVKRTRFNGNKDPNGTVAVGAADNANEFFIERSIFVNNAAPVAGNSVLLRSSGPTRVLYSDLLDNPVTRLFFFSGDTLNVQGSIFADPGTPIWFHTTGTTMVHNDCLLTNTTSDIPGGATLESSPAMGADFTPLPRTQALDFCNDNGYTPINDIYGHAAYDIPGIANFLGDKDLGAVEQTDIIFYGGFGNYPSD